MRTSRRRPGAARRAADLRLLLPALVAWISVGVLLGSPPRQVVGYALASSGVGLATLSAARLNRQRHRARASPRRWLSALAFCCFATALTLAGLAAATAVREAGPVRQLAAQRAVATVTGTIASDPRLLDPPRGRPESTSSVLLRLTVDRVTARGTESVVQSPVLVFGDQSWLGTRWQQRVQVTGRLAPPTHPADDVVAVLTPSRSPETLDEPGPVAAAAQWCAPASPRQPTACRRMRAGCFPASSSATRRARRASSTTRCSSPE